LTKKKQKDALHVVMCKYYSSYMVIIYPPSSKKASKQHMEDDDVSKWGHGWRAIPGLFPSHSWWEESCNVRLSRRIVCSRQPRSFPLLK
jgi:hypothetical protein